ncbi:MULTISPECIES: hypothetical protein [unclassified Hahella]|uniref:hypothetical protein n=1 Tax=unclassified Hahella TaxID=2624107 RepID=UPI001C1EEE16|nr:MULTISPECIES: hypothetical protein [unclassified Hahella]MBU6950663.1 hypothetical protein [Hahella sp. HN01]MDG9669783.1 hypothetical protein [Hahella sp. CR1]
MDWQWLQNPEFWKYLSIPLVAALIGWSTNWLAIKLTFYPLEFIGFRPFLGWQGIIPSKAEKMAVISVDSTISKLGAVDELFEQIDPQALAGHIVAGILPRVEEYVDEIMLSEHRTLWENLPQAVKNKVYERVRKNAPRLIDNLVSDIGRQIEELLDLKHMVTERLVADKELLNRIFLECGAAEFRFLIYSGLWLGFGFGVLQMALWYFYSVDWVLPVCGFLVGWATNWIALNLIFRPLNPAKVGPVTIQGLFLKRQPQVAATFCRIVTHDILTVGNIVNAMLNGPNGARTRALVKKHVKPLVDVTTGVAKPITQIAFGPTAFAELKKKVGEKALEISKTAFKDPLFNEERAIVVENIMRTRMEALSPEEFQDLLRPCFQEDEIKLIAIGGVLGALAGLAQVFFVFT